MAGIAWLEGRYQAFLREPRRLIRDDQAAEFISELNCNFASVRTRVETTLLSTFENHLGARTHDQENDPRSQIARGGTA